MRVLVTGASAGLGLGAARSLRDAGHAVVVHARSATRTGDLGDGWDEVVFGDLADRDEVDGLATQLDALDPLDAVIHNAGVSSGPILEVNLLAPYLLTATMPRPARLVSLSSSMHRGGSTDLGLLDRGRISYSDSKLHVTALAFALADRWPGTAVHAVDPGWVPTRMGGAGAPDDLAAGHETQVWLATGDHVDPATGAYWHHRRPRDPHPAVRDPGFQSDLVARLERLTGVALPPA